MSDISGYTSGRNEDGKNREHNNVAFPVHLKDIVLYIVPDHMYRHTGYKYMIILLPVWYNIHLF